MAVLGYGIVIDLTKTYTQSFYARPTVAVARDLLGAVLCRRTDNGDILSAPIVEVEAYTEDDPACHAFRGKTERNAVMFGPGGNAYVYFIYGMYYCLNAVTEIDGTPGAVLIRAIGSDGCNGPGRLCRRWEINRKHNGMSLLEPNGELWICPGSRVLDLQVAVSGRIGIRQEAAIEYPWRFYLKDHPQVSRLTGVKRKTRV